MGLRCIQGYRVRWLVLGGIRNDEAIVRDPIYRKRVFDADIIELCVR